MNQCVPTQPRAVMIVVGNTVVEDGVWNQYVQIMWSVMIDVENTVVANDVLNQNVKLVQDMGMIDVYGMEVEGGVSNQCVQIRR